MNIVNGTVTDVRDMDAGRRSAITIHTTYGRDMYLVADNSKGTVIDATMKGAMAHEDMVEIRFEPTTPRLGAPVGVIVGARIMGYETEIGHAA